MKQKSSLTNRQPKTKKATLVKPLLSRPKTSTKHQPTCVSLGQCRSLTFCYSVLGLFNRCVTEEETISINCDWVPGLQTVALYP